MSQKIRVGNDIAIQWSLIDAEGYPYDLGNRDVSIEIVVAEKKRVRIKNVETVGNTAKFVYYGKDQKYTGRCDLKFIENDGEVEMVTFDTKDAFTLVAHSWLAVDEGETPETIQLEFVTVTSELMEKIGPPGFSPIANVTKVDDTATITITDKNGTTTATVHDGSDATVTREKVVEVLGGEPVLEETDPTVPNWAKQPNKPAYTPQEVGALPAGTELKDLPTDSGHRTVSDAEKASWITKTVNDLTNYYLKSETYTKAEIAQILSVITTGFWQSVPSLPTASADTFGFKIYLVPSPDPKVQNQKDEYITVRNGSEGNYTYAWEQIGSTAIDLSDYVTTNDLQSALSDYITTSDLSTALSGKQDTLVSGTNIKTINGDSILGSGNIEIQGGGGSDPDAVKYTQQSLTDAQKTQARTNIGAGTSSFSGSYNDLSNKPTIPDPLLTYTESGDVDPTVTPADYATREELDQLEAKVDDLWKLDDSPIDISTFKNGYISTNGNYSTVVNASSGTKCRNFDVLPGQKYKIFGTSAASGWYRLWAVFAADGTRISICPSGDYTTTPAEVTIPENGVHMTVNLYNYSAETDKVLLVGNVVDAATLQAEIEGNSFDNDVVKKQADFSMENEMRSNPFSPILIDWMQLCHAKNGMTSVEQMSVVSATETALTLSSSDASAFANPSPAVVGFSDGSYKVVYFQASSGTTVERRDFETTDLTNAVTVQSLHDTVSGGYGIHLSAGGYLALGQFTAEELTKRESQKDRNLITGANFYYCPPANNPSNIVDAGGREICKISGTFDGNGQIPGGIIAGWGIPSSDNQMYGYSSGWIAKCFQFDQNGNGKYLDLDFPCSGKGFVEIQCALLKYNNYFTGTAKMEVFADDTLLETYVLVYNQTKYKVDANVKRNLRIRFTLTSASSTYCLLYSVNFWRMPSFVPIPSFAGTKIAVLGDSWTQFPGPGAELEDHPDFNVLVTRPDGSEGGNGGYGYFPKELARVLNATVDNWGYGGKTAGNWGVPEIDTVLAFTDYDYVLIEFFINDFNAGDPIDKWVRNLKIICNRCIARGVRPIVIVPCLTNSAGLAGGTWHEYIMRGLMELP